MITRKKICSCKPTILEYKAEIKVRDIVLNGLRTELSETKKELFLATHKIFCLTEELNKIKLNKWEL